MQGKIGHIILAILMLSVSTGGISQILELVDYGIEEANNQLLREINRKERKILANELKTTGEENIKLVAAVEQAKKQLEVSEKIYDHYQKMMEAIETVSSTVRTMKEIEEFHHYFTSIMKMYSENGVKITTQSLYDFDKYLNPEKQQYYMKMLTGLYEQTLLVVSKFNMVLINKNTGVKAKEYERWKAIREYNNQVKSLHSSMRQIVYLMNYLAPMEDSDIKANIEIKKSFYNINTYAK